MVVLLLLVALGLYPEPHIRLTLPQRRLLALPSLHRVPPRGPEDVPEAAPGDGAKLELLDEILSGGSHQPQRDLLGGGQWFRLGQHCLLILRNDLAGEWSTLIRQDPSR